MESLQCLSKNHGVARAALINKKTKHGTKNNLIIIYMRRTTSTRHRPTIPEESQHSNSSANIKSRLQVKPKISTSANNPRTGLKISPHNIAQARREAAGLNLNGAPEPTGSGCVGGGPGEINQGRQGILGPLGVWEVIAGVLIYGGFRVFSLSFSHFIAKY